MANATRCGRDAKLITDYVIHPIVCGRNATDQGIMTYLKGSGKAIHVPVYM
ncbi:hypothetical protein DFAR_4000016 [Desulfarculales bacterium]